MLMCNIQNVAGHSIDSYLIFKILADLQVPASFKLCNYRIRTVGSPSTMYMTDSNYCKFSGALYRLSEIRLYSLRENIEAYCGDKSLFF